MNHGGCRISTRRESTRAAFAVYYSTAKKTALPLNETYTLRPPDTLQRDHVIKMQVDRAHAQHTTRVDARIAEIKKHTMK
jgi:hypothetical protein